MENFKLKGEYITLGQFIKVVGIISNGGEAKHYLANNMPVINGIEDNRRGRKIRIGDIVEVENQKFTIE